MTQETSQKDNNNPTCFVIMPISDIDTYEAGHFGRVYEYIIKPACKNSGFEPVRADDVQTTNHIIIDILRKILDADMVVCDLSARNPNVLYELGIRQAFNKPVTLIKDSKTPRIFDIQGLRDVEYDESLRTDKVVAAVDLLTGALENTSKMDKSEVNSIIQLLGVKAATAPTVEISDDTNLILESISNLSSRIAGIEDKIQPKRKAFTPMGSAIKVLGNATPLDKNGHPIKFNDTIFLPVMGKGLVIDIKGDNLDILFEDGSLVKLNFMKGETQTLEVIKQ